MRRKKHADNAKKQSPFTSKGTGQSREGTDDLIVADFRKDSAGDAVFASMGGALPRTATTTTLNPLGGLSSEIVDHDALSRKRKADQLAGYSSLPGTASEYKGAPAHTMKLVDVGGLDDKHREAPTNRNKTEFCAARGNGSVDVDPSAAPSVKRFDVDTVADSRAVNDRKRKVMAQAPSARDTGSESGFVVVSPVLDRRQEATAGAAAAPNRRQPKEFTQCQASLADGTTVNRISASVFTEGLSTNGSDDDTGGGLSDPEDPEWLNRNPSAVPGVKSSALRKNRWRGEQGPRLAREDSKPDDDGYGDLTNAPRLPAVSLQPIMGDKGSGRDSGHVIDYTPTSIA